MMYCKKTPRKAFLIGIVFCSACTAHLQKPVQKITIITNKNVKVISVEGQLPSASIKRYSRQDIDSQKVKLRQLYIEAKLRYKNSVKQPGKIAKVYFVPRSNKAIGVVLSIDSMQKTVYIKPHRDYGSYLNLKYVFRIKDSSDVYKYKNWTYHRKNLIATSENDLKVSRFEPIKKGTVNITISPGAQFLNLRRDTGRYDKGG